MAWFCAVSRKRCPSAIGARQAAYRGERQAANTTVLERLGLLPHDRPPTRPHRQALTLSVPSRSARHSEFSRWLQAVVDADEAFGVSDLVLSAFLRIVTSPRVFRTPASLPEAIGFADALRSAPNAVPLAPGKRHWAIFTRLCRDVEAKGNLVPDASWQHSPSSRVASGSPPTAISRASRACAGATRWTEARRAQPKRRSASRARPPKPRVRARRCRSGTGSAGSASLRAAFIAWRAGLNGNRAETTRMTS